MLHKTLTLKSASLPKILADLKHANQFLKVFSLLALFVLVVESVSVLMLLERRVSVVALDRFAQRFEVIEKIPPDREVEMAIRAYISQRYCWSPADVSRNLESASAFISSNMRTKYLDGVSKVERFSKDRQVVQRAYVDQIQIDIKSSIAQVQGSRITSIQNLKAAGDLKLQLSFESGPRTKENPWGVYIRQEKEELN
jgi:hypothetical protein